MTEHALLGPWVRRFLLEHLIAERNLAPNTQRSYATPCVCSLPFAARSARKGIDRSGSRTSRPLGSGPSWVSWPRRGCGEATRNQRLAAIRSLAHFVGLRSPEHVQWCAEIRSIPFKKALRPWVTYLERRKWTRCSERPRCVRLRAVGIMPCCCSFTTPGRARMRQPMSEWWTSIWAKYRSGIRHRS